MRKASGTIHYGYQDVYRHYGWTLCQFKNHDIVLHKLTSKICPSAPSVWSDRPTLSYRSIYICLGQSDCKAKRLLLAANGQSMLAAKWIRPPASAYEPTCLLCTDLLHKESLSCRISASEKERLSVWWAMLAVSLVVSPTSGSRQGPLLSG